MRGGGRGACIGDEAGKGLHGGMLCIHVSHVQQLHLQHGFTLHVPHHTVSSTTFTMDPRTVQGVTTHIRPQHSATALFRYTYTYSESSITWTLLYRKQRAEFGRNRVFVNRVINFSQYMTAAR